VLPFENLGAAGDEYFADGITEEITARLARIKELGVIARTSVLRYKDTELSVDRIGEELGVDYILEGTVRWQRAEGELSRVRVTPQLIKVADATHVWADVFDEPLTAVFEVQSAIAGKVIDEMNLTLVGTAAREVQKPTDNMEAYDAYLRGYNLIYTGEPSSVLYNQVATALQRAIELDPDFADAYAAMSAVHSDLYWFGYPTEENRRKSYEYGARALELNPNSADVRHAMGMYYYHCELDYDRALEQLEAALRIQPNHAEAIAAIGYVNRRKGDFDAAVEYLRKASQLDPRFYHYYYEIGETLVDMRRYEEALWYFDKSLELKPDNGGPILWKALDYVLWKGDTRAARQAILEMDTTTARGKRFYVYNTCGWLDLLGRKYERALAGLKAARFDADSDHRSFRPRTEMIADAYWLMGNREMARVYADSARAIVEGHMRDAPDHRLVAALGHAYSLMGEKEKALEAARKAVELMPVSTEAKQGPWRVFDLMIVLIRVGEVDEAIEKIEYLLSIPGGFVSVPYLRIDPIFDPLRDHPRFEAIVGG
jgi:serine/threonine-protein kinase